MTYSFDQDNSWLDAMVQESPAPQVTKSAKKTTTSKGLYQLSPEAREKHAQHMRLAFAGKKRPASVGAKVSATKRANPYVPTPEQNAKRSAALAGKTRPPEVVAKISKANLGRKNSAEVRAKMSANSAIAKPIMTPTGVFPSCRAAGNWALANGLVNAHMKIRKWLTTHPEMFYYITKDTK
jgi:hypothetical protein